MSYYEVYQGGEPSWRPYDNSYYDSNSYDRPYDSASLVPVRVIERGHVSPDRVERNIQKQDKTSTYWDSSDQRKTQRQDKTGTYWDSSDRYVNYNSQGYDYHRPSSSFYDYNYVDQTPTVIVQSSRPNDYGYPTSRFDDHNSYGRSGSYDYSYSSSPEYSLYYDYSDNYPTSSMYSQHNDNHHYRSNDAYRYR